jgi:methane monooxygenase component D
MHMDEARVNIDGEFLPDDPAAVLIHTDGRYTAYGKDVEFMWRWEIQRDGEFVQEGCSLTERATHEAVAHVIRYMNRQDAARARPDDVTNEIRRLLREAGLGAPELARES